MATARPGWSRRAQYGLFFSFLAVIAGIVVGVILLTLSLVSPKSFNTVRGAALDLTAPITGALHEVTATAGGLFTGAGNYWDAANQNAKLKRERQAMLHRMVEAKAILQENRQLKATLQLREREPEYGRDGAHCRLLLQQPAAFRDPFGRIDGRRAHRNAGPLGRRPGRAGSSTRGHLPHACFSSPTARTLCQPASYAAAAL